MVEEEVPVVIAGGGLVGLSTATFLARHGVASLAVERLRGGSPLPRAAHFHVRTIELFRSAGIEPAVRARSEEEFLPEGAIIAMDTLSGRKLADIVASLNEGVDDDLSPCRRLFVSQPGLEPILRAAARSSGADVVEGHEVVAVDQDADGVDVRLRDVDSGAERTIRCRYLVGADGAHSRVRDALGIPVDGRGSFSNSITIYFTADLWPQLGDKPLSVIYINNEVFGGFFRVDKACRTGFLVVNTVAPPAGGDIADAASDTSEARLVELVRAGAGVPDLAVRIDGVARWRSSTDVARRYGDGRVFLAGDAAHVMPPNGGFGGNTGIHDAHDLAWKLAYVVRGLAHPSLLSTYEAERRPVGVMTVEQAYARYVTRTATHLGATDHQPVRADLDVELGYLYRSDAIQVPDHDDGAVAADPRLTRARPGSRAPHLWLDRDGERISTLDLLGRGLVVLTDGGSVDDWRRAARDATAARRGPDVEVVGIGGAGLAVPEGSFADRYGLEDGGAVLVRPDGFVAWKAPTGSVEHVGGLPGAIDAVLGTP